MKANRVDAQHRGDHLEDEVLDELDSLILADALFEGTSIKKVENKDRRMSC